MRPLTKQEILLISGGMDDEDSSTSSSSSSSSSSSWWSSSSLSTSSSSSDDEIVVIGPEHENNDDPDEDPGLDEGGSEDGEGGGDGEPDPICEQADAQASAEAAEINSAVGQIPGVINTATVEYQSIIYTDASGVVQSFGPMAGQPAGSTGAIFDFTALNNAFAAAGHDTDSIVATIHNHPGGTFGGVDENRYPSSTDWLNAEGRVAQGADPSTYTV